MSLFESLVRRAQELSSQSLLMLPNREGWEAGLPERRRQWREMLGIEPLPERTEMHPTITGVLDRRNFVVEKLHFQPIPSCRIAANVYRPARIEAPLPAVVYLCGHSQRAKFHYQLHPRWFAEHGYVAIILDAIQIGENAGFHHGTNRNQWWHWFSQAYTPAGVEVWAAMRAVDYLEARPEVDAHRVGITGLSGGGTISWFAGAADERFNVVAPVCQTGTMYQHIAERTVDIHCDCSFPINLYGWDHPEVAALIAPRPLFVDATSEDVLFRPYAYRDVVQRARMVYRLYGRDDLVRLVEDIGPHGYTPKIRLELFSWFERYLKSVEAPATEDLATDPIPDDELAVYPDRRPPANDRLGEADRFFIVLPEAPRVEDREQWQRHRRQAIAQLRATTFRDVPPERMMPHVEARPAGQSAGGFAYRTFIFESEPGLTLRAHLGFPLEAPAPFPLVVAPLQADSRRSQNVEGTGLTGAKGLRTEKIAAGSVEVRGTGATSIGPGIEWTLRRSYPLVGQTLPERQTFDLLRGIDVLRRQAGAGPVALYGTGEAAALAIYAALLDESISEVILEAPLTTHWNSAPEFLGVLRVGDLPHNLALLFPRPITFVGEIPEAYRWTQSTYETCGEGSRVRTIGSLREWALFGG
ncbi:MAG: acetylxylan esterase [Chloroflexi bacterium]|nr:acetylxylan esterase [Chloroflexota bacterium]